MSASSRSALALVLSLPFVSLAWICLVYSELAAYPWANHDVALIVRVAANILDGQMLYVDQIITNPPAIFYVNVLTTALAEAAGLSPLFAHHLLVVLWGASGLALLGHAFVASRDARAGFVPVALAHIATVSWAGLAIGDFGQREHLFILGFVPYFFWTVLGRPWGGHPSRMLIGLYLVGLGVLASAKPFFVMMIAASELSWLSRGVRAAAPVWAALLVGALAPLAALGAHSLDSLRALVWEVIPLHLGGPYSAYDNPVGAYLMSRRHLYLLVVCAPTVALLPFAWRDIPDRVRTVTALLASAGIAYASIYIQHKFWRYHAIPCAVVCVVGGAFLGALAVEQLSRQAVRRLGRWGLVASLVGAVGVGQLALARTMRTNLPAVAICLEPLLAGRRTVMLLATGIEGDIIRLSFYRDIELIESWNHNVRFPALAHDPSPAGHAERATYVKGVARRIDAAGPDLVIFSGRGQALPFGDDGRRTTLHEYFVGDHGLFPREGYARAPENYSAECISRLDRWAVYARTSTEDSRATAESGP